jgi:lysophospholipase L1-like esterase
VSCTTNDANQQRASCEFTVTVARPPQIAVTRFLSFGDSITAGVLPDFCTGGAPPQRNPQCTAPPVPSLTARLLDRQLMSVSGNASPAAYPLKLVGLLSARYTAQALTVVNEGEPGRTAVEDVGRLRQALIAHAPQALLLQEGINDINFGQARAIGPLISALRSMIREASGRGVRVFLGTLLPQDPCGCRAFDYSDGIDDITTANGQIRALAAQENATLVDLHSAFQGQVGTLLIFDGLHPNETGYAKIADVFFEAIRAGLEAP